MTAVGVFSFFPEIIGMNSPLSQSPGSSVQLYHQATFSLVRSAHSEFATPL